jgi:Na+/proline symporter/signal transduction histidine kinase
MFDNNTLQTALINISNNLAPVDYMIVLGYFVITMIIGLVLGGKIKTIKEYAVGGRNFSPQILFATVMATLIGAGETINMAERVFSVGIIYAVTVTIAEVLIYIFIGRYIVSNVWKFVTDDTITMGDLMKAFYGNFGRYTTSITGTLFYLGLISVELLAFGIVINQLMGLDQKISIVIGGVIMISYCALGGIKAVTFTDVFQFLVLLVAIPFAGAEILKSNGMIPEVIRSVPEHYIKFWNREDTTEYILLFFTWLVPAFSLSPAMVQRFFMTKDTKSLSKLFYYCAAFTIPLYFIVSLIGLCALKTNPNMTPSHAMSTMILTATPPLIKGFAIAGLIAVIMSTVDSMLNSGGILIIHDFVAPMVEKYRKPDSEKEFDELFWARMATIVLGGLSVVGALAPAKILDIILIAIMFWNPIVVIPFIAGVLGLNAKPACFKYSAIAVGITALLCWVIDGFDGKLLDINIILLLVNILVFFGTHWKLGPIEPPKGKGKNNKNLTPPKPAFSLTDIKTSFKNFKAALKELTPEFIGLWLISRPKVWGRKLIEASNTRVDHFGANYIEFALFCALWYTIPLFIWNPPERPHTGLINLIRFSSCILVVCLLLYHYTWPARWRQYFAPVWHFTLLYSLPFFTVFGFILQNGDSDWLINIGLAVLLLFTLVDWQSLIVILILGVTLGILAAASVISEPLQLSSFHNMQALAYVVSFATIIGLVFNRRKELATRDKIETMKMFGGAMAHEVRTPLSAIQMYHSLVDSIVLSRVEKKARKEENEYQINVKMNEPEHEIFQIARDVMVSTPKAGMQMVDVLLMALKDKIPNQEKGLYSLKDTIHKALSSYAMTPKERKRVVFKDGFKDFQYYSSQEFMKHLFYNLIKNAFKYALNVKHTASLTIWVEGRKVYVKDTGPGIDKKKLNKIFDKFYTTSGTGTGIGLSFCQMVMRDLGGEIDCVSKEGEHSTFVITFPPVDELTLLRLERKKQKLEKEQDEAVSNVA